MTLDQFLELRQKVQSSYRSRKEQEQQIKKKIWDGHDTEVAELTSIVSEAFSTLLDELGPLAASWTKPGNPGGKILDYEVLCSPDADNFVIIVTQVQKPDGTTLNESECPHIYLEPLTSVLYLYTRVNEFQKKYHVAYIQNPENYCKHQ